MVFEDDQSNGVI